MSKLSRGQAMLRWLADAGGYVHPGAVLRDDPHTGLSLFTTAPLAADERIISCPFSVAITPELAARAVSQVTGIPEDAFRSTDGAWGERMLAAAYIGLHWVWEDKNETHPALAHGPYIAALPPPGELTTPLYFSDRERELLAATNLLPAVAEREAAWRAEWEEVKRVLKVDGLTWDRYLAVGTYLSSRAFPSRLLRLPDGETTTCMDDESHPVLLPGLDMLNHARGQPILWLSSRIASAGEPVPAISFVAAAPQDAGTQVFNNYGAKANEELLMEYGFVIPSNPDDTVGLRLGGAPAEAEAGLASRGLDAGERFAVGRDGELPKRLLEVVRVMMGEEEHEDDDEEDEHAAHAHEEQSMNRELDVLGMLGEMLEDKMEKLAAEVDTEGARPEIVDMVAEYRKGQIDILNTALDKLGERVERIEGLMSEGMECPCGC